MHTYMEQTQDNLYRGESSCAVSSAGKFDVLSNPVNITTDVSVTSWTARRSILSFFWQTLRGLLFQRKTKAKKKWQHLQFGRYIYAGRILSRVTGEILIARWCILCSFVFSVGNKLRCIRGGIRWFHLSECEHMWLCFTTVHKLFRIWKNCIPYAWNAGCRRYRCTHFSCDCHAKFCGVGTSVSLHCPEKPEKKQQQRWELNTSLEFLSFSVFLADMRMLEMFG